jgi:DNA-binding response OmpR family regulator
VTTPWQKPSASGSSPLPDGRRPCALVVDADAELAGLIEQWLQPEGLQVRTAPCAASGAGLDFADELAVALVIVDLPFPSRACVDAVRARLGRHGHAPLVVLSTRVFASVDCCGPAARSFGADGLLPKPTTGDALRRVVRHLAGA